MLKFFVFFKWKYGTVFGLELSKDMRPSISPIYILPLRSGTGSVVKINVKDGVEVVEGQPVLVLEAMKMEVCCWLNYCLSICLTIKLDLHRKFLFLFSILPKHRIFNWSQVSSGW